MVSYIKFFLFLFFFFRQFWGLLALTVGLLSTSPQDVIWVVFQGISSAVEEKKELYVLHVDCKVLKPCLFWTILHTDLSMHSKLRVHTPWLMKINKVEEVLLLQGLKRCLNWLEKSFQARQSLSFVSCQREKTPTYMVWLCNISWSLNVM